MPDRMIFCLSPGRCATQYLARMLALCPGVYAVHEREPHDRAGALDFVGVARASRLRLSESRRWWREVKLPYIASLDAEVYAETAHTFGKGPAEALLSLVDDAETVVPDVVVLRRPHREVALSMWRRKSIPARTPAGQQYTLHPAAPRFLALPGWERFSSYQLCYWYCLEMERRMRWLAAEVAERGGRVYETTTAELTTGAGFLALVQALGLPESDRDAWEGERARRFNATPPQLRSRQPGDLDAQEQAIEQAVVDAADYEPPRDGRPSVSIRVLTNGQMRMELSDALLRASHDERYRLSIGRHWANPTSSNRNEIAREFRLDELRPEWLAMIDNDQAPAGDWLRWVESPHDVVVFPTPCWRAGCGITTNIEPAGEMAGQALPLAHGGTGMILIRRSVLEHPDMRWPFCDEFDADGVRYGGHDYLFTERARALGFDVVAAMDAPSRHWVDVDLMTFMGGG